MQISLKLSRAQKYAKITKYIKFQVLMISSSFFIGASVLPVFPRPVLYTAPAAGLLDLHSEDARAPLYVESPELPLKFLPRLPGPANFQNRFTVCFGIVFRDDFELARV